MSRQGDNYVDPLVQAAAGSLGTSIRRRTIDDDQPWRDTPVVGRRRTSWRRKAGGTVTQQASSLAAASGGTRIDRHKPYVYGASKQSLRTPVITAVTRAIIEGQVKD